MKLKKGDLIMIDNTDCLQKPINQFHKKWEMAIPPAMAHATAMVTAMVPPSAPVMVVETATENETGKKVKLKYRGLVWKRFENNRLIGIVTEVFSEEHRDFDVIKIREQTGGIRCCRRYILENV